MKVLIIVPTYNEYDNLNKLVDGLFDLRLVDVQLLIVDDNSPDGTGQLADNMARYQNGLIHVLHRPEKMGLGSAYLEGFRWALDRGFDVVCQMDADGSHQPADLPKLLAAVEFADVSIGSRLVEGGKIIGWSKTRHCMSWCANRMTRLVLDLETQDVTAGFRCMTRTAVDVLLAAGLKSVGYSFQEESLLVFERTGMLIEEIPVTFYDRRFGKSKLAPGDVLEFIRVLILLRQNKKRNGF